MDCLAACLFGRVKRKRANVRVNSVMGQCQAAVAEAVETFGKLDILLCCSSEG